LKTTSKLTLTKLLGLIERARNAEISRDVAGLREILREVCDEVENPPEYDFEEAVTGELYRLHGVYACFYGLFSSRKNYQVKAKDFLTRAIGIFERLNIPDKAAEAKINLSFCYLNLDDKENAEALLNLVEVEFKDAPLHPVYLQLKINQLLICQYRNHIKEGIKIINQIISPMQFCSDARLQGMFHMQAGVLFRRDKKYEKAVFHLAEAIHYAEIADNMVYVASNYNNLAQLYKEIKEFEKAVSAITTAINKFKSINDKGFLPHALDTQALIYLEWNKPELALTCINESLEIFTFGEDYRGLTEALWNKINILFLLEHHDQTLEVFAELYKTAKTNISDAAAEKFSKEFQSLIYFPKGKTLWQQEENFRRSRVEAALLRTKGKITSAARILGLPSHETLGYMLDRQFPDLRKKYNCEKKNRRKKTEPASHRVILDAEHIHSESIISPVADISKKFVFDFPIAENFEIYYFDCEAMNIFGIETGAIVAVTRCEPEEGKTAVVRYGGILAYGVVRQDATGVLYLVVGDGEWLPVSVHDEYYLGIAAGFCSLTNAEKPVLEFRSF
jgi:tetratricopeptide (TPR) repeat protein